MLSIYYSHACPPRLFASPQDHDTQLYKILASVTGIGYVLEIVSIRGILQFLSKRVTIRYVTLSSLSLYCNYINQLSHNYLKGKSPQTNYYTYMCKENYLSHQEEKVHCRFVESHPQQSGLVHQQNSPSFHHEVSSHFPQKMELKDFLDGCYHYYFCL